MPTILRVQKGVKIEERRPVQSVQVWGDHPLKQALGQERLGPTFGSHLISPSCRGIKSLRNGHTWLHGGRWRDDKRGIHLRDRMAGETADEKVLSGLAYREQRDLSLAFGNAGVRVRSLRPGERRATQ